MNHENLWAPWRLVYLRELDRRARQIGRVEDVPANFFAAYWDDPEGDEFHFIIHRNEHGIILLNRYPYCNGHLLVALGDPRPALLDYEPAQRAEFWKLIEFGMELMQRTINPQGINMGINQGHAAGAGVPEHLHAHLVPRWNADTNFITSIGQLRVIPDALEAMAEQYRKTLEDMKA
jgi:ATP adenylyltransferase